MNKEMKLFMYILCIVFIMLITSFITKEIIWIKAQKKYSAIISKIYANTIYGFSKNKELVILEIAISTIGNEISHIEIDTKLEISRYRDLCPNLNEQFKNTILNYYDKQNLKEENDNFLKGYDKLYIFCKKV